jgi:hypothetical protein
MVLPLPTGALQDTGSCSREGLMGREGATLFAGRSGWKRTLAGVGRCGG